MERNGMNSSMLTVVYFSILQHKLVSLLRYDTFTVRYSESVITTDKPASNRPLLWNSKF